MLIRKVTALAVASGAAYIHAANITFDWQVGYVENVNPDGLFERKAIGVNGQFPPPIINVNETDSVLINLRNSLGDGTATSLHNHGLFFNRTAYFDGAVGVNQCPIPDGQMIPYETINSPNSPPGRQSQHGTYWSHGHYIGQSPDGLRTPNIIHATNEPHQYDDDYTIILADWYHDFYPKLVDKEFLNAKNPTGAEPVPDSALVYFAHTPQNGTASYLPGFNENVTLPFEAGKTYRLRLINMSTLSMYHVWLDGHQMRVIEADGIDTQEHDVDIVSLAVAQRYSILVTARNDTSQNWNFHFNLDPDMYDKVPETLQLNRTATLSYKEGNAIGVERPEVLEYPYFDDTQLVPVEVVPMEEADVKFTMAFNFDTFQDGKNYAFFNDVSYVSPLVPSLLTAQTMALNYTINAAVYGPNSNAIVVSHMQMVEIELVNLDSGSHPIHIHGTVLQLVHKSTDDASSDPSVNPTFKEGQSNPMRRDVVQIPGGGSATVRFRADNPGVFLAHCHINWHLSSGLAFTLVEAPELMNEIKTPSFIAEQCRMMGMPTSGNAGGLSSTTEFGALPAGPVPLESGWTAKAIGTLIACIISAIIGLATICWYGFSNEGHSDTDDDKEEESSTVERVL